MKLIESSNVKRLVYRLIQQLELYSQRSRTRKQLLQMDADALRDIGLTQQQALQEGRRYFWQGVSADVCVDVTLSGKDEIMKLSRSV